MLPKLITFVLLVYSVNSSKAPFITKCKAEDSNCMKESAQVAMPIVAAGIPELGVESLDPIFFKSIDGSSNGLTLKLYNFTGTGFKDCKVLKLQRDVVNPKLTLKVDCSVEFRGQYFMKGQVLILHIEGKGDSHVVLRRIIITVDADIGEKVGSDGENHWTIKSYKYKYALKERATFELQNLFPGNEVLGQAARALFNTSSNEIIEEAGQPIVLAIVSKVMDNISNLFSHVPLNDLVLD